jgi:hypothetical protein
MQLKLAVTYNDGESFQVATNLFTVVSWERKFKRKASDMANGIGIEDLAFLAHTAAKDNGISVPLMLDDFIKKCSSIDVVGQEDENPTDPAPTDTL